MPKMKDTSEQAFADFCEAFGADAVIGTFSKGNSSHSFNFELTPRCECDRLEDLKYALISFAEHSESKGLKAVALACAAAMAVEIRDHRGEAPETVHPRGVH